MQKKMSYWVVFFITTTVLVTANVMDQCSDGELRLTETSSIEGDAGNAGRLEVCLNSQWGTIAADSFTTPWSEKNAQVACQQLGFSGALNSIFLNTISTLDRANSLVLVHYSGVVCDGTESRLENCSLNRISGSLNHSNDVFIVCRPTIIGRRLFGPYTNLHFISPKRGDIRLLGSPDNGAGAVEIYTDNVGWTGICPDSSWTDEDARTVCRALGYDSGVAQTFEIESDVVESRQATSIQCADNAAIRPGSISAGVCSLIVGNCSLPEDFFAGVVCSTAQSSVPGSVRLFGGDDYRSGVVEIHFDGRWGVICDDFTPQTAELACLELGYSSVNTRTIRPSSSRRFLDRESPLKPLWLSTNCPSSATSFSDCYQNQPIGFGDCNGILTINCTSCEDGDLRLTETTNIDRSGNAGRLEVCLSNVWGTIAADTFTTLWSEKNAQVACRQLGFSGALNSIFQNTIPSEDEADSSVSVYYSGVVCDGTESRLENCLLNRVSGTLSHSNDVFIVCRPTRSAGFTIYSDLHTPGPNAGDIRLLGSPDNGAGAVEIYTDNVGWTGICPDSSWTDEDAETVCRALGYDSGIAQTFEITNDAIERRQATDIQCTDERENRPGFVSAGVCSLSLFGSCSAREGSFAGVVCSTSNSSTAGTFRFFGEKKAFEAEGIVEVLYNGQWGVLCDVSLSSTAEVLCQQLGYDPDHYRTRNLDRVSETYSSLLRNENGLKPVWVSGLNCSSSENSLSQCQRDDVIGYGSCLTITAITCGSRESSNSGLVGGLAGLGAVLFVVFVMVSFSVCVILPLHVYHHRQQARVSSKSDVVSSMETDSTTVPDKQTEAQESYFNA